MHGLELSLSFCPFLNSLVGLLVPHPYQDLLFGIIHARGYYGAWPGQVVPVSGSLTKL